MPQDRTPYSDDVSDLFRDAVRGNAVAYRNALSILACQLRRHVRAALTRAGRNSADCEDIVQETLLAIHVTRHTWDEQRPIGPWVRAIANYKLLDHLRRGGHASHVAIDDVADVLANAVEPDVARRIDGRRLLEALPQRQQSVVHGMAVEGRSASEVAEALGMTEGAVRVTLHRALKTMSSSVLKDGKQ